MEAKQPVDEEAEIRRRRQRREEILRKSRTSTPMQNLSLQADINAAASTPGGDSSHLTPTPQRTEANTPHSCMIPPPPPSRPLQRSHANRRLTVGGAASPAMSPAAPPEASTPGALDLANDQDLINTHGRLKRGRSIGRRL